MFTYNDSVKISLLIPFN